MKHFIVVNFNLYELTLRRLETSDFQSETMIHLVDNSERSNKELSFLNFQRDVLELASNKGIEVEFYDVENHGFAHANNFVLKKLLKTCPETDVLILLNNDASLKFGCEELDALSNFESRNCLWGASLHLVDRDDNKRGFQALGGYSQVLPGVYTPILESERNDLVEISGYINGAFIAGSVNAFKKIGLLPEEYFLYFEETEWCRRAMDFGVKLYGNPRICVFHEHGASSSSSTKRRSLRQFKHKNYFYLRNMVYHFRHRGEKRYVPHYFWITLKFLALKSAGVFLWDVNKWARFCMLLNAIKDGFGELENG